MSRLVSLDAKPSQALSFEPTCTILPTWGWTPTVWLFLNFEAGRGSSSSPVCFTLSQVALWGCEMQFLLFRMAVLRAELTRMPLGESGRGQEVICPVLPVYRLSAIPLWARVRLGYQVLGTLQILCLERHLRSNCQLWLEGDEAVIPSGRGCVLLQTRTQEPMFHLTSATQWLWYIGSIILHF